ncbi:Helix-turn-helix domain-containing protein [Streptomyces sp. 2112.2]|uniref:helix-turn-helix domain-containing protein n=1 Tax=Streptomyces sp. 2112.2 TaxID=1881024 RepID=UPI0008993856|nr:helix-turn-helix transcriptional regulator [Streptomyces sp. 2112.2]SED63519.1 Helix-turn-helix domain-containing protein [Streptomyces sp. 2112.2]
MAAKRGATGRRLELGLQLRQMRESIVMKTGKPMTRKAAVTGTKLSEAALQRIETGALNFRNVGDLRKLLDKYGVTDEEVIETLVELNRDSSNQDWVTRYRRVMQAGMPTFVGVESEAREIRVYQPTAVHGLLQTEGYAQAIFDIGKPVEETTTEFCRQNVALRMERKERVLRREPDPVKLWVILGEAALRHIVGDIEVMREQYEEITKLAALDHVAIQVLPLAGRGYRASHDFAILDLGDGLPPMVQIDTAWGAVSTSDKPREVDRFKRRFDTMMSSALPPEDTAEFMQRLDRELKSH